MMKRILPRHVVLFLAVPGMAACTTKTDGPAVATPAAKSTQLPILIRQNLRNEMTLQALFMGRLHLDANGCLRAGDEVGPIIIWHHDTRIERAPDGRIRVNDPLTGNAVHIGDEIALSGGYRAGPATSVTEPVPQSCQPQNRVFVAGRVVSEAQRQDMLARQRNRPIAPLPPAAKRKRE
jgi:hypothetical protein